MSNHYTLSALLGITLSEDIISGQLNGISISGGFGTPGVSKSGPSRFAQNKGRDREAEFPEHTDPPPFEFFNIPPELAAHVGEGS
jgi:hypothetical protein